MAWVRLVIAFLSSFSVSLNPFSAVVRWSDFGNTRWVAVATGGELAEAADPTGAWTARTSSFGATNILGVHFADSTWVITGGSGKIATSPG